MGGGMDQEARRVRWAKVLHVGGTVIVILSVFLSIVLAILLWTKPWLFSRSSPSSKLGPAFYGNALLGSLSVACGGVLAMLLFTRRWWWWPALVIVVFTVVAVLFFVSMAGVPT